MQYTWGHKLPTVSTRVTNCLLHILWIRRTMLIEIACKCGLVLCVHFRPNYSKGTSAHFFIRHFYSAHTLQRIKSGFNAFKNDSVDCLVVSAKFLRKVESSHAEFSNNLSRCAAERVFTRSFLLLSIRCRIWLTIFPFFGNFSCFHNFNRITRLVDVKTKLSHVICIFIFEIFFTRKGVHAALLCLLLCVLEII